MKALKILGVIFPVVLLLIIIALGLTLLRYYEANEQWQAESERLQTLAQSDYYRGILSSCVGIGMQMSMPRELVATRCTSFMNSAYKNDWYNELQIDSWTWPPEKRVHTQGRDS